MHNRQALEDAVFNVYPDIDMDEIERMPDDQLIWLLDLKRQKREERKLDEVTPPRPRKPVAVWEKHSSTFEVRRGELVHIETWRVANDAGETMREYVQQCADRVWYDGRMVSASILRHFLLTGQWVKRIPKPRKYRAIVREGRRTIHLGYFLSEEDRDAAVFAWRLGLRENT